MAEVITNDIAKGVWNAQSAGAKPYGVIHHLTIETLKAHNHNTDGLYSKALTGFIDKPFDAVITVCDNARQSCPIWPGQTHVEHWDIEDPSAFSGTSDQKRALFEKIYQNILIHVQNFLNKWIIG
jgi:arsenate reductase